MSEKDSKMLPGEATGIPGNILSSSGPGPAQGGPGNIGEKILSILDRVPAYNPARQGAIHW